MLSFEDNKLVRVLLWPFINLQRTYHRFLYRFTEDSKKIRELKNTHVGERCFVIGNGPSLNCADLEALKEEFCFGFNRIFEIFKECSWRPDIYMCIDKNVLHDSVEEIMDFEFPMYITLDAKDNKKIKDKENVTNILNYVPFKVNRYSRVRNLPFSSDPSLYFVGGATVTYAAIQLAAYMGFSEIYLLGVDNTYSHQIDSKGRVTVDNRIKDYFGTLKTKPYTVQAVETVNAAYNSAAKHAKDKGFNIYNSTRGGKLEVFPRVALEEILNKKA